MNVNRKTSLPIRISSLICAALLCLVFLLPAAFAATPLGSNLLINPDAESGTTQGWVCPGRQWVAAAEITPHGGAKFFWPGSGDVADTTMYQDVDVSDLASSIDASALYLHLSGWLANWDQYPHDRATLSIYALDAQGATLSFSSAQHRSPQWTQYRFDKPVPAGTRTLRVELRATRFVGTDDDGYFDDLSLTVDGTLGASVTVTSQNGLSYLNAGTTLQLSAATVGSTDSGYDWSSSFNSVATVDSTGKVTGVATGRATIQAKGKDTGAIGSFDVSVIPVNGLVFVEPSAGKVLAGGGTTLVTWDQVGTPGSATLYSSMDGGVSFAQVAPVPDSSVGHYSWSVPAVVSDVRNAMLKLTYAGGESYSPLFSVVVPTLSVTLNGAGSGSVQSVPSGIACASGSATGCSHTYLGDEQIVLTPLPDSLSTAGSWNGCDSVSVDNHCLVAMTAARAVTLNFDLVPKAKILNTGFVTLSDACTAAVNGDRILALDILFHENLSLTTAGKRITLAGGYETSYAARSGLPTILEGILSITNGCFVADRLAVR